jgi:hypothetical protein
MRKFSSERLYKLVRAIVIITSILSLLFAIYNFHLVNSNITLNAYEKACNNTYFTKDFNRADCMGIGYTEINREEADLNKLLVIGIFLPIIFFGGRLAYKYVFPKTKKE